MVLTPLRKGNNEEASNGFIDFTMGDRAFKRLHAKTRQMILRNSRTLAAELPTPERDSFTAKDAGRISTPTPLVRGERSPHMFQTITSILSKSMPRATVFTIRDSSHAPYSTHPARYNKAVLDFLRDT
jgi:pimeloyl-ACP methyl ester carboxylesterase